MSVNVAIVGGGPAGTATSTFLSKKGISSIVIEKHAFPRFHIGESMTGECGNIVRAMGLESAMKDHGHVVKRGVTVYGPKGNNSFFVAVKRRNEQDELEDTFTWQVRRATFDQMLLDYARDNGAHYLEADVVAAVLDGKGAVRGVRVRPDGGQEYDIEADVVVDASGQQTFFSNAGFTSPKERGKYDRQVAIFSHFTHTDRAGNDDTVIFYRELHQWGWFIPLDDEVVSIGIVTPFEYFRASGLSKQEFIEQELRILNPALAERVRDAKMVEEARAASNYSYHVREFTGDAWLCVGDSHRFIDPIFSFGLGVGMTEGAKAADAIHGYLEGAGRGAPNPFLAYQDECERGLDVYQLLLDGFWTNPLAFGYLLHNRYTDDFTDIFAGRVYGEMTSPGYQALRGMSGLPPTVATPVEDFDIPAELTA